MTVWVSLLRAVNLGARNKVPMPALREALTEAGFSDVQTYVQSGNVVTTSRHRSPDGVAAKVRSVVREHFDVDTPVVVRSPEQLAAVLDWDPFPDAAAERPKVVQVNHLTAEPDPAAVQELLALDLPEGFAHRGLELVVDYRDNIHSSKVSPDWLRRRLGVDSTARNWRTLTALVDLTR